MPRSAWVNTPIFPRARTCTPSKFVAGFTNFEVVTRYNRSTFYASAVLELGDAILKARGLVQLASAQPTKILLQ